MDTRALRRTLYAAAFLRALAIGLMAVLLGLYTARLGFSAPQVGAVLSSALWGAALAALLTLAIGHRFTQRSLLVTLATLPALGAVALLAAEGFTLILVAAFVGLFNVHGRDRGAIPILEQALLPLTATDADRTRVFAGYNVLLDVGYAGGGLLAALPTHFESTLGLPPVEAMRVALALFCVLYGAAAILYARLPAAIPRAESVSLARLSPASRPIVAKISALFFLDAFGGGFIGSTGCACTPSCSPGRCGARARRRRSATGPRAPARPRRGWRRGRRRRRTARRSNTRRAPSR